MAQDTTQALQGTCFVVMGFGKKTDFESGRTLDLDKTYRNIIKPAAEAARLKCIRADEIVHSGLIDIPMYEQLLEADVVIADLSTSNKNAFYELGIRHALRPYTTLVIAEDGIKAFPFDVNHVVVRQYHHLGEDIGFDEVMNFRKVLTDAINTILETKPRKNDSPIYTFLSLTPPALQKNKGAGNGVPAAVAEEQSAAPGDEVATKTHRALMEQVETAQARKDFLAAKVLLETIRNLMKQPVNPEETTAIPRPEDPTIIQRLALVTYKSEKPTAREALEEAKSVLQVLNPETSNDTETLGLWGAIHKRLFEIAGKETDLDEAVRAYERGFYLRNDYYNGINLAYLLNVRSGHTTNRAEAIADFVQAQRIRREVLDIAQNLLKVEELPADSKYWAFATIAEAYLGLGDEANSAKYLHEAFAIAPKDWMKDTTADQQKKLRDLLGKSPLKYISVESNI